MTAEEREQLEALCRRGRRLVIETVRHAGAGHVGGPLSAMEILVTLYFKVLRVDPARPRWPERDRFVLSKGHASVGLYTVMALRGYLPVEELKTFDHMGSRLQGHPDMTALEGLDMSTGSLGQGLSVAVGMALGSMRLGTGVRVFCLLGDGECQEGQVWEAAHSAASLGLGNLVAVVDRNGLPQFAWAGRRRGEVVAWDLGRRFCAFGWQVREVDVHDVGALAQALVPSPDGPVAVIARTVKGKGVSFMENDYSWHSRVATAEELARAIAELEAPA